MKKSMFRSIMKIIVLTALLILCIVRLDAVGRFLSAVLSAFAPLLIGFAIAFILHRPFNFFRRHLEKTRVKKAATALAVIISYLIFLAVIVAVLAFIIPQISKNIQRFTSNFSDYFTSAQVWLDGVISRFHFSFLEGFDLPSLGSIIQSLLSRAGDLLSLLSTHVISLTGSVISWIVKIFLSFVFSVYMLAGSRRLLAQCRRLVLAYLPDKASGPLLEITRLTADTFTNFISGQFIEACILGMLCFIGMCVFRFEYASLISVIVACCALVPIIGSFMGAAISALLLAMVSPTMAFWFLVFLIILMQLEANIIYPRVVGKSIGLPSIWVLGAVTVGGGLFGFVGLLIAVPATSVLYTLIQRNMRARLKIKTNRAREWGVPPEKDRTRT